MNKVAIVILNFNGRNFLEKFLPEVLKYSVGEGIKIYLADNNSSDDSVAFLKANFNEIELICLTDNFGYAGGYNIALEQIKSEYFVLLNSDVEVTKDWLNPVIEYMDKHQEVSAAMPKINAYDNKESFEYAGASGGFIDKYGYPFCRGRLLYKIENDFGQHESIIDIFWASGACLFVRAKIFFESGGFDNDFFAHMEEIDLCWRMKRLGYRVVVVPESVIYHVGGGTLPINTPFKMYLNYRNNLFLLQKNLPGNKFFTILFIRLCLDGASAIVYLSKLSFGFFGAVIKAHFHFYLNLRNTQHKRHQFNKLAKNNSVGQIYPHSMVFNFMMKRRRLFEHYKF